MNKKRIFILFFVLTTSLLTGHTQQQIVCKGKIIDSSNNLPLQNVKIYKVFNSDTVLYQSNNAGEFQISLQMGSRLLLKKSGYAWQIVRINTDDIKQIKMVSSKNSSKPIISYDGIIDDDIDLYIDGQLVPESEVIDAISLDSKDLDLSFLRVISKQMSKNGRSKMYLKTL